MTSCLGTGNKSRTSNKCDSNLTGFRKRKFLLAHEKKIAHYKVEACQGKFVFIVEGFARFSLEKRLESLPVYSCLLKLDL